MLVILKIFITIIQFFIRSDYSDYFKRKWVIQLEMLLNNEKLDYNNSIYKFIFFSRTKNRIQII